MTRPDNKTLRSLASLSGNINFTALIEWYQRELDRTHVRMENEKSEELNRLQGDARTLRSLIKFASTAREVVAAESEKTNGEHQPIGSFD